MKLFSILPRLLLFPLGTAAETLLRRAVKVVDGDTVYILDAGKQQHKIRLAGIDAPERKQPFGKKSKQYLSDLVAGKQVKVEWTKRDRYKRIVGKIVHNDQDVNLSMVRTGLAWWYRKYAAEQAPHDRELYAGAEASAMRVQRGLWADPNPMPPWDWRKRPEPTGGYAATCPCGGKEICTGPRGGRFCVRGSGSKRYLKSD